MSEHDLPPDDGSGYVTGTAYNRAVAHYEAEVARLREALSTAADDLDKAANQFEGVRQSQLAGHTVPISGNPSKFAEKAQRAREALEAGER